MNKNIDSAVRHVIDVVLKQVQTVYNNLEELKNNTELDEKIKSTANNFYGYHMAVLSVILEQLSEQSLERYPDAKPLVDWAHENYEHGVKNKFITPCACDECSLNINLVDLTPVNCEPKER